MYKFKHRSFMLIIPTKTSKWRSHAEEVLDICPKNSQELKLETFTSKLKMTVLLFLFIFYLIYIMIFCLVVAQLVISVPVVVIRFSVKCQSCTVAHLIKQQDSDIS